MDTTNNLTYNKRYDRSVRPLPKGSLPLWEYYWYPGWDSNPRHRLRQKRTLSTELPDKKRGDVNGLIHFAAPYA